MSAPRKRTAEQVSPAQQITRPLLADANGAPLCFLKLQSRETRRTAMHSSTTTGKSWTCGEWPLGNDEDHPCLYETIVCAPLVIDEVERPHEQDQHEQLSVDTTHESAQEVDTSSEEHTYE